MFKYLFLKDKSIMDSEDSLVLPAPVKFFHFIDIFQKKKINVFHIVFLTLRTLYLCRKNAIGLKMAGGIRLQF